ncbi:hypothetical protein KI387_002259, partial [Taxus chinensis]
DQIRGPWNAYDPEADRWHPLPPIPWANSNQRHLGFSCISVAKKFLVIGGHYTPLDILGPLKKFTATNEVVQFDPFTNQWSKVAGMRVARSNLACAAVRGKVYVAGGYSQSCLGLLDSLGYLNLSYNNLSGRIPRDGHMLTFDNSSSYLGNPHLWGCPLERNCSLPHLQQSAPPVPTMDDEEERDEGFP